MGGCFGKLTAPVDERVDGQAAGSYEAELCSSYEEACRLDPQLRSFTTALRRQTSLVISSLADDARVLKSLSFGSLREATDGLLEVSREAFSTILELKDEISGNAELLFFVKEYFKNNVEILRFFAALKGCLRRARDTETIVRDAINLFEKEEYSSSHEATLEKLEEFKAAGHPFTEDFISEFKSVCQHQKSMIVELHAKKRQLDEKLGCVKAWRKVWSVVFAATFATVVICSVVLAAISAPPAATAAAAAAAGAMAPIGEWFDSMWDSYEGMVDEQREVIRTVRRGTFFAVHELDSIRVVVEQLEINIQSMLFNAEQGIGGDGALRSVVLEIKKRVVLLTESVEKLETEVDRCSDDLRQSSAAILQAITSGR